ncbi:MAG: WG repeat-containing protein, partial [Cyanobacteria bacterium HKST-UBA02]|nr:WG repeat-containing protein [Cyanobacteria bacterium HKST-UBA02]
LVIPALYRTTGAFHQGRAAVCDASGGGYGYIDSTGKVLGKLGFSEAFEFSEDRAVVVEDGETYRFVDLEIKPVGSLTFDEADSFHGGYAAVQKDGKWGFLNRDGNYAVKPQFDSVGSFIDGRASVKVGKLWGIIDNTGKFLIKPVFRRLIAVEKPLDTNGLYPYGEYKKGWGYLDQDGQVKIEPQPSFRMVESYSEGIARVATGTPCPWQQIDSETKRIKEDGVAESPSPDSVLKQAEADYKEKLKEAEKEATEEDRQAAREEAEADLADARATFEESRGGLADGANLDLSQIGNK